MNLTAVMARSADFFGRHQLAQESPPDWQALAPETPDDVDPAEDGWDLEPDDSEIHNRNATATPASLAAAQLADLEPVGAVIEAALRAKSPQARRTILAALSEQLPAIAATDGDFADQLAGDMAAAFLAGAADASGTSESSNPQSAIRTPQS